MDGKGLINAASNCGRGVRKALYNAFSAGSRVPVKVSSSKAPDMNKLMNWAKSNSAEAEQLAFDSTRLLSQVTTRLEYLKNQGFFRRCWKRFNGEMSTLESANINDLISLQQNSTRYLTQIQRQNIIQIGCMVSLRNSINTLTGKVEENRRMILDNLAQVGYLADQVTQLNRLLDDTRDMIFELAEATNARFNDVERRIQSIERKLDEVNGFHSFILSLTERDYAHRFPSPLIRIMRIVNDLYQRKNTPWTVEEHYMLLKALRESGLDPEVTIAGGEVIDFIIDQIVCFDPLFQMLPEELIRNFPSKIKDSSKFVLAEIEVPAFKALHAAAVSYGESARRVNPLDNNNCLQLRHFLKENINFILGDTLLFGNRISYGDIASDFLEGVHLCSQMALVKSMHGSRSPGKIQINRGVDALPFFREIIQYLLKGSTSLAKRRFLIRNKLNIYSVDRDENKNKSVPSNILEICKGVNITPGKGDIRFYAFADGKYYIRLNKYIIGFDALANHYGLIKYNLKDIEMADRLIKYKNSPINPSFINHKAVNDSVKIKDFLRYERSLNKRLNNELKINAAKKQRMDNALFYAKETVGLVGAGVCVLGKGILDIVIGGKR